jgi:hypothetical protein
VCGAILAGVAIGADSVGLGTCTCTGVSADDSCARTVMWPWPIGADGA